jgi:ferric-dicitrate binding protein FerR (iron transport regulator)
VKPEKQRLWDDLIQAPSGDGRRETILREGRRILRRRRTARLATRFLALAAVAILCALAVPRKPATYPQASALPPQTASGEEPVRYLTDEELLALFPNTPVGLIKTPDGKKRLIFPRPGDEAKYIIHL